jgi:uncharacterized protein (TIGR03086 family)
MSEVLAMWRTVADEFTERVEAIGPDDWAKQTCCSEWDVRGLLDHAIGAQRMVPTALGATGAIETKDDDLQQTWKVVRAAAEEALSKPDVLAQTVTLPFGSMPAEQGLGIPLGDMLIHTWDLARAIGANDRLSAEACAAVLSNLEPLDALIRSPQIFGPKLEPAPGADAQDRLLAFVGRQV